MLTTFALNCVSDKLRWVYESGLLFIAHMKTDEIVD